MKSNNFGSMLTSRKLNIFDKNDTFDLAQSMHEISSVKGKGIILPLPTSLDNNMHKPCQVIIDQTVKNDLKTNFHFDQFPVGTSPGYQGNIDAYTPTPSGNAKICDASIANANGKGHELPLKSFKMELDSHANMPVVGKGAHVEFTGNTADVKAFSPQFETAQIPIVDAVVQYDCQHSGQSYLLMIRNALYVPEMNNHLIPPFIMREAGIKVYDVPKIHMDD